METTEKTSQNLAALAKQERYPRFEIEFKRKVSEFIVNNPEYVELKKEHSHYTNLVNTLRSY